MPFQTLLYITGEQLMACTWHKGAMSEKQYFQDDPESRNRFALFLKQNPHPARVLVDLVEEDFRVENIPHLRGKNRSELIARKFEHYYRGTPFRLARKLFRHHEGRRDDEMLFSALINPQRISPWLDILLDNHIPVIAIQSVPYLCAALLPGINVRHVLLLTQQQHAGLRQTYFQQNHLRFSRLSPVSNETSFATAVSTELPRTLQYLSSLNLPQPGEALYVYIVCHAQEFPAMAPLLINTPEQHHCLLDIQALSKKLKLPDACPDSDATTLFLHLMAKNSFPGNYATPAHSHYFRLSQLRRLMFRFAAITALASIAWGSVAFWQGQHYQSQTLPLLAEASQLEQQSATLAMQLTSKNVSVEEMKTAVTLSQRLGNIAPQPLQILSGLGRALEQFKRIHLTKLSWLADTSHTRQRITVEAELPDAGDDLRGALAYLDSFKQTLEAQGYTLDAATMPLDDSGTFTETSAPDQRNLVHFTYVLGWSHP